MTSKTNSIPEAATHADISVSTAAQKPRLEVGARVEILGYKHLRCARTGHVLSISGAYNYVRPDDAPVTTFGPDDRVYELYPNELKVLANYRHKDITLGAVVRIKDLDWGKTKARSHGIVCGVEATRIILQPIGARKGAIIAVAPEALQLEKNDGKLAAEDLVTQLALVAVLRALDKSVALTDLKSLMASQSAQSDIDANLARLANDDKITLTESHAQASHGDSDKSAPDATQLALRDAIEALAAAQKRLTDAVHATIVQAA
jgi:hypothetical protein